MIRLLSRLGFLLALACGCHQVFGLEREDDGIPDPDAGTGSGADAKSGCWASAEDGDEDHDLMVDGCDQCPAHVDTMVRDNDHDSVGDLCDPDDDAANKIVVFDGFRTDRAWEQTSGKWTRSDPNDGEFSQTIAGPGFKYAELIVPPVRFPTIDVRFTPEPGGCITQCGAGAALVFPSTRVACIYEFRNGSDQVTLYVNDVEMGGSQWDAAGAVEIRLSAQVGGKVECRGYAGSQSGLASATISVENATTRVGLVTKADTAKFQSALVISTP